MKEGNDHGPVLLSIPRGLEELDNISTVEGEFTSSTDGSRSHDTIQSLLLEKPIVPFRTQPLLIFLPKRTQITQKKDGGSPVDEVRWTYGDREDETVLLRVVSESLLIKSRSGIPDCDRCNI